MLGGARADKALGGCDEGDSTRGAMYPTDDTALGTAYCPVVDTEDKGSWYGVATSAGISYSLSPPKPNSELMLSSRVRGGGVGSTDTP